MNGHKVDVVFVIPGDHGKIYQDLSKDISGLEPPTLACLTATYLNQSRLSVRIIDISASKKPINEVLNEVLYSNPYLVVIFVYGHQPSASTQLMPSVRTFCESFKQLSNIPILLTGTHIAALPERTMKEEDIDFACDGEGFKTIQQIIYALKMEDSHYENIPNLWYRENGNIIRSKGSYLLSINELNQISVPAWNLLDMSIYRAHNWHCFHDIDHRSPYASIYTSFGCPFHCTFCCINAPFGKPSYRLMNPKNIIKQIDILVNKYNVENIKIIDEMFVLNKFHVNEICDLIIDRGYKLNIWAYSRIDTAEDSILSKLKKAGFNWLGLGIESSEKNIRNFSGKNLTNNNIIEICKRIQSYGIHLGNNYIFGLPNDTIESMQATLDLAIELNAEKTNFYSAMAYPGSKLHQTTKYPKPENFPEIGWIGYSQHSYLCYPLKTETLENWQVLQFRDEAFNIYYSGEKYQTMMKKTFGEKIQEHLDDMLTYKLKRKLLGD